MADNFGSQIIGELGQIAKDVGKQTIQLPKDIAGKALESLGASGGKKQGAGVQKPVPQAEGGKSRSAWEQMTTEPDQAIRRQIARKALEELAGGRIKKEREPSIWERLQQEQEQKKQQLAQQKAQSAQALPNTGSKRPAGDLYGAKAKKTATENRNVRQD
jgi:hypothetical protein